MKSFIHYITEAGNDDSHITHGKGHTTFVGPDAVKLFQAKAIASGLRLYAKTKMKPNRAWTPTAMLRTASSITGKSYKRHEHLKAADDLDKWAAEMNTALPHIKKEETTISEAKVPFQMAVKCDFQQNPIDKVLDGHSHDVSNVIYDAKTKFGPWAAMCHTCFQKYGVGLGLGKGQKFQKHPDGKYYKVEG